jgi:hypothetical protein
MSDKSKNTDTTKGNYYTIAPAQPQTLSKQPVSTTDDSPALIQARLAETILSLRQLISTNKQLDEILLREEYDQELMLALEENDALITRKTEECAGMRRKLLDFGVDVDVELPIYDGSKVLQQRKNLDGEGLYL